MALILFVLLSLYLPWFYLSVDRVTENENLVTGGDTISHFTNSGAKVLKFSEICKFISFSLVVLDGFILTN